MFIDNINHQNIKTDINLIDINTRFPKKQNKNFMDDLITAIGEMNKYQKHAKIDSEKFILNESDTSLNDTMINLEKSSISIQMAIQIRNKIISAYQEIMSQQI